jgi:hypothetical protein
VIAVLTLLVAVPIGWSVRDRVAAYLVYGLLMSHVFTFQTANLLMEWVDGSTTAFPRDGGTTLADTWPYLLVTSLVYAAGLGLVALGRWLRARHDGRRGVELATAP